MNLEEIRVYPNPATDEMTITGAGDVQAAQLTDAFGKVMPVAFSGSPEKLLLHVHALPVGVYLLEIVSNSRDFHERILVSR